MLIYDLRPSKFELNIKRSNKRCAGPVAVAGYDGGRHVHDEDEDDDVICRY